MVAVVVVLAAARQGRAFGCRCSGGQQHALVFRIRAEWGLSAEVFPSSDCNWHATETCTTEFCSYYRIFAAISNRQARTGLVAVLTSLYVCILTIRCPVKCQAPRPCLRRLSLSSGCLRAPRTSSLARHWWSSARLCSTFVAPAPSPVAHWGPLWTLTIFESGQSWTCLLMETTLHVRVMRNALEAVLWTPCSAPRVATRYDATA